ncbi:MAG: cysteine--tRNA ligase [Candidatus Dadabacteria bacterium]|nr:cysteine--tRNA ligase [Candidatus Dadabacteria bacterium]
MANELPKITTYNSLNKKKEEIIPHEGNKIRMYACGPTVYDSAHLGHARSAVSFDIVQRFLRHAGYDVTFVRNYTDVDDKIINRANDLGVSPTEISEKYIKEYKEDMSSIGVETPDVEPKVTDHIDQIISMIEKIIERGYAYQSGNDVFFSVRKFKEYGKLSGRSVDSMLEGVRIDINEKKDDPLDFALWKGAKEGEPFWPSPWGNGRPGWHIECSVMSMEYLGTNFEIHGGGKDLIFPHHENEIAQSEAASGENFTKYWLHNGLIQINSEKMSKSLGNFFTVQNAVKRWSPESIRLFFLSHHYQNPADFSEKVMDDTESSLERIYTTLKRAKDLDHNSQTTDPELENTTNKFKENWFVSMCDNFNTAESIGSLFELIRAINKSIDKNGWTISLKDSLEEIKKFGKVLGILEKDPDEYLNSRKSSKNLEGISKEEIEDLIEERKTARSEKNWARADEIRTELDSKGIILEDKADGTVWKVK